MSEQDKINKMGIIAEIGSAFMFLSRLPVPQRLFQNGFPNLNDSLWAFPVVGAVIGLIGAGIMMLASALHIPMGVAVVFALIAMVMTTGGLHEDGLADMADGFGSHKGAEEIARIMKDSVIGSYGTIALICLFFMRWTSMSAIEISMILALLPLSMAVGRASVVLALITTPLSPHASLGKMLSKPEMPVIFVTSFILFLLASFISFGAVLAGLLAALSGFVIIRALAIRKIGGLTGDVMGALIVTTELLFLIGVISYG